MADVCLRILAMADADADDEEHDSAGEKGLSQFCDGQFECEALPLLLS